MTTKQTAPKGATNKTAKDVPPGAKAVTTAPAKPVLTDEQRKAIRSERRKARRVAKMKAAGKIPLADRPKLEATGRVLPRAGTARLFCYELQKANGMPEVQELAQLMQDHAKGTAFEGRAKRWYNRRAWRNVRLYGSKLVAPVAVGAEAGDSDD